MITQWAEYKRPITGETSAGWLRNGRLTPGELIGADFWTQAARVVIAGEGKTLDSVHSYTGKVVAGPFEATVENGELDSLLGQLPMHLLEIHLGDAFSMSGLSLRVVPPYAFTVGIRMGDHSAVNAMMRLDRDVEKMWVDGLGALLSDPGARRSLGKAYGARVKKQSVYELEDRFGFRAFQAPPNEELRRCAAAFLAFAFEDEKGAAALSRQCGPSADSMIEVANRPGPWPQTFASKSTRIRMAIDREVW
jgi:hypothetical protein